jgi:hypothetical protein
MMTIFMTIAKSLMTEWLFKRIAYQGLKALVASTKNELDDEAVFIVGQGLGLEDKDDEFEGEED